MPVRAPLLLATALRVLAAMKSISADCKCRPIADEGRAVTRKQPVGQISVQPRCEKYFASPFGRNSFMDSNCPTLQRGVSRSSRTRGADAVDAAASGVKRDAGRVGERPVSDQTAR